MHNEKSKYRLEEQNETCKNPSLPNPPPIPFAPKARTKTKNSLQTRLVNFSRCRRFYYLRARKKGEAFVFGEAPCNREKQNVQLSEGYRTDICLGLFFPFVC